MEELTNAAAEFAKNHVDTRWLSMKLTCVRVPEQWDNLYEYFFTFLPTQKSFKREILLCVTKESKQLWRTQQLKLKNIFSGIQFYRKKDNKKLKHCL